MDKLSNWFRNRTLRELKLLQLLGLLIIFIGAGQFIESVWGFVLLGGGLLLFQVSAARVVANHILLLAQKEMSKMAEDVDKQLETIFQHIRGEN